MNEASFSEESIARVQQNLQDLLDSLPEQDKPVLETLLVHAADGAGSASGGSAEQRSIIIVGGTVAQEVRISLNPGVLVGLNPQPLPPGPPETG